MSTKIAVADLHPNPFRNLKHYPLNPEKVAALIASIKSTEFWDNLLVRKAPDGDGYEIAYGHHRLEALKKTKTAYVELPVRKLTNTKMAQIMAHENMEEWGHSASIEQETVRSIVEAYGRGDIELPKPSGRKDQVRYAPSFVVDPDLRAHAPSSPYTIETLKDFLGWTEYKVTSALDSLALIERKLATPKTFRGLSSRQSEAVAGQVRRVSEIKGAETAKVVANTLAAGFRKTTDKDEEDKRSNSGRQTVTIHSARRVADEVAGIKTHKPKTLPSFGQFIKAFTSSVEWFFDNKKHQWDSVMACRNDMPRGERNDLIKALRNLIKQAEKYLSKLEEVSDSDKKETTRALEYNKS